MKKILLTIGVVAMSVSAFSQGIAIFGSNGTYVFNTNSLRAAAGTVNTAFLFSTVNIAPTIASVLTSTTTNTGTATLSQSQNTSAWNSILTDPNFQLAFNNTASSLVVGTTTGAGGISYNGGSGFVLNGTSASGGNIFVYAIAWNAQYATAAAAAAAGAALGWSPVFSYAYVAGPTPGPAGTPTSMGAQASGWQFGVLSTAVAPVPEPSTLVLAGLGGLSLLAFRRKK